MNKVKTKDTFYSIGTNLIIQNNEIFFWSTINNSYDILFSPTQLLIYINLYYVNTQEQATYLIWRNGDLGQ
jgi:hypothetical protein